MDTFLFRLINRDSANPLFDWAMPWITDGGKLQTLLILCGLGLLAAGFASRDRARALLAVRVVLLCLATVILFEWIFSQGLRNLVCRPRPPFALSDVILRTGVTQSFSFPSSHAGNAVGVATIILAGYRPLGWVLLGYAALVAYSRVYCGVHFPLDIAVGSVLGALLATGLWKLTARWAPAP